MSPDHILAFLFMIAGTIAILSALGRGLSALLTAIANRPPSGRRRLADVTLGQIAMAPLVALAWLVRRSPRIRVTVVSRARPKLLTGAALRESELAAGVTPTEPGPPPVKPMSKDVFIAENARPTETDPWILARDALAAQRRHLQRRAALGNPLGSGVETAKIGRTMGEKALAGTKHLTSGWVLTPPGRSGTVTRLHNTLTHESFFGDDIESLFREAGVSARARAHVVVRALLLWPDCVELSDKGRRKPSSLVLTPRMLFEENRRRNEAWRRSRGTHHGGEPYGRV